MFVCFALLLLLFLFAFIFIAFSFIENYSNFGGRYVASTCT